MDFVGEVGLFLLFLSRARKQIGMWIVDCVVVFFRGTCLYVAGCIFTHTLEILSESLRRSRLSLFLLLFGRH